MMTKKIILRGKTLTSNIFYFLGLSFIDINNNNIYTIKSSQIGDDINKASGTLSNNIEFTITSSSTSLGKIENVLSLNNTKLNKWNAENSWNSQNLPDSYVEIVFNESIDLKYICIMLWNQSKEYNIRDYFIYECYDESDILIGGGFLGNLDITKIKPFDTVSNTVEKLYLKIMPLGKLIKENISYNFDTKTKQIQEGDFGLLPIFLPDLTGYEKLIIKDKIQVQKPIEVKFPYVLLTINDIPLNNKIYNWTIPYFTPHSSNFRFLIKLNDEEKWYYFKSLTLLEEFIGDDYSIIPAYTFTGTTWTYYMEKVLNIPKIELKKVSIKFIILNNSQIFESVNFNINSFLYIPEYYKTVITIENNEKILNVKTSVATVTNIKWYEEKIEDYPNKTTKIKNIELSNLNLSNKFIYDNENNKITLKVSTKESVLNDESSEYEINLSELGNWEVLENA